MLIVGGGPAGAVTALVVARAGHRVTLIDRPEPEDRSPTVGLITPRGITEIERLGLELPTPHHRIRNIRLSYPGADHLPATSTTIPWPPDPSSERDTAITVGGSTVSGTLLSAARGAGVTVIDDINATAAIVERGFVRGAHGVTSDGTPIELRARFTVIADGANSRFGRQLGTVRRPTWPFAVVHRASYPCRLSEAAEIDIVVGLRDAGDTAITGHAWMLPAGDGTATVTVTIMSTSPSFAVINPDRLLEQVVATHADRWRIDPDPISAPSGGRLPLGLSVGPVAGPNYVLVGDAAGAANPITGLGVEAAIETGHLAGDVLVEAIESDAAAALQRYPQLLDERFGQYYKTGRLSSRVFSHPSVSQRLARLAAHRRFATTAVARIASRHLRPGRLGPAELAYRAAQALDAITPDA